MVGRQRLTHKQVNAATEGKFEDVEVAWGGRPLQRQLAEFKFKQVISVTRATCRSVNNLVALVHLLTSF